MHRTLVFRVLPALLLSATPVLAHNMWLEPLPMCPPPGTTVEVRTRIGDGKTMRDATLQPDRMLRFEVRGHGDPKSIALATGEIPASQFAAERGQSTVVAETEPKHIDLKPATFNQYLKEEGLNAALAERKKRGEMNKSAREDYMRCMKALVRTSRKETPVDGPVGCPYELVLSRVVSRTHTIQTLRHGEPEGGLQVRLWNLDTGRVWKTVRSDKSGKITLPLPPGRWLATSVAMRRSSELQSDWRSDWASLTWETPAAR